MRECLVFLSKGAKKAEQRQPSGDEEQHGLLENITLAEKFFAVQLLLRLGLKHEHRRIFREVHSAFVALHAVILKVPARRTFISDGRVAAAAELNFFRVVLAAFRADHSKIIRSSQG